MAISMEHERDDFRASQFKTIRTKLGEALREQYDVTEPPPQSLIDLLRKMEIRECTREITEARLYAEVDECVAAMVQPADRKPREPQA